MGLDLFHLTPVKDIYRNETLEYFTVEELNISPVYVEKHASFVIEKDFDESGKESIIYFKTKGYQRKGMNSNFYIDFENDKLYFDLQNVIKAYKYLQADHINSLDRLQENFKKNFINNFEEGKSIFLISW